MTAAGVGDAGVRGAVLLLLGIAAASIGVAALYVGGYANESFPAPVGYDTPLYQYQAGAIAHAGTDGLEGWAPPYVNERGTRVSTALLWAILASVTSREASSIALVWPATIAVAVGLAAAAFARLLWREPPWALPIYVVTTGASVQVARTAGGSLDNLTVDPVILVAAATALAATALAGARGGGWATAAAVVLLAAAVPIHWVLATALAALFGIVAILQIPESVRRHREGVGWPRLPSVRLGAIVGGGLGAGWAAVLAVAGRPEQLPPLRLEKVLAKDAARASPAATWLQGVAAVAGAIPLLRRPAPARWGTWFMVAWGLTVPVAAVALHVLDRAVPAYRVSAFALAIPVLATTAFTWSVRSIAQARARRRTAAAARKGSHHVVTAVAFAGLAVALGAVLVVGVVWASRVWRSHEPVVEGLAPQAAIAAAYVRSAVPEGPVLVITTMPTPRLPDRVVRAAMPGDAVARVVVAAGRLRDLAAGRPSTGDSRLAAASAETWPEARAALDAGAPVLQLSTMTPGEQPIEGSTTLGNGVSLVRGPMPAAGFDPASATDRWSWPDLMIGAAWLLAVLFAAGVGWSWAAVPGDAGTRLLAAPGVGIAALALGGLVLDGAGAVPSGGNAALLVAALAIGGFVTAASRRRT